METFWIGFAYGAGAMLIFVAVIIMLFMLIPPYDPYHLKDTNFREVKRGENPQIDPTPGNGETISSPTDKKRKGS